MTRRATIAVIAVVAMLCGACALPPNVAGQRRDCERRQAIWSRVLYPWGYGETQTKGNNDE